MLADGMVVLTLAGVLGEGAMAGNALVSKLTEVLVDALVDEGTATGLGDVLTEVGLGDTVVVTRKVKFVAMMLPTSSNSTPI